MDALNLHVNVCKPGQGPREQDSEHRCSCPADWHLQIFQEAFRSHTVLEDLQILELYLCCFWYSKYKYVNLWSVILIPRSPGIFTYLWGCICIVFDIGTTHKEMYCSKHIARKSQNRHMHICIYASHLFVRVCTCIQNKNWTITLCKYVRVHKTKTEHVFSFHISLETHTPCTSDLDIYTCSHICVLDTSTHTNRMIRCANIIHSDLSLSLSLQ